MEIYHHFYMVVLHVCFMAIYCSPLKPQMDEAKAMALLDELDKHFAIVMVVKSAPAASLFSQMGGSIVYEKVATCPLRDFFNISTKTLGRQGAGDQRSAVRNL